jgi:hypothetical protein
MGEGMKKKGTKVITKLESASPVWVNRWEVISPTSGRKYTVGQKSDGTFGCDCPAWKFKKAPRPDCKHILYLKATEPVDTRDVAVILAAVNKSGSRTAVIQHREQAAKVRETRQAPSQPVFLLQTRRSIQLVD